MLTRQENIEIDCPKHSRVSKKPGSLRICGGKRAFASGILLGFPKLLERVERSGFVEHPESRHVQAGFYK